MLVQEPWESEKARVLEERKRIMKGDTKVSYETKTNHLLSENNLAEHPQTHF